MSYFLCTFQIKVQTVAARTTLTQVPHPQSNMFWSMWIMLVTVWASGHATVPTGSTRRYDWLIWGSPKSQLSRGDHRRLLNGYSGSEIENIKIVVCKQNLGQLYTPPLNLEVSSYILSLLHCTPFPLFCPPAKAYIAKKPAEMEVTAPASH